MNIVQGKSFIYRVFLLVAFYCTQLSGAVTAFSLTSFNRPIIELLKEQYYKTVVTVPITAEENPSGPLPEYVQNSIDVQDLTAIEFSVQESLSKPYIKMQSALHQAIEKFKHSNDYGEMALQNILDLLDTELLVTDCLIRGHTGAALERAFYRKNARLKESSPSVAFIYENILDIVSNDERFNKEIRRHNKVGKSLLHTLNRYDRKAFLLTMKDKLEQYKEIIQSLQNSVAINGSIAVENFEHARR